MSASSCHQNLEDIVVDVQEGDIERSTTKVLNYGALLIAVLVQTVGSCGGHRGAAR